ncbi:MAG: hypothetical protein IJ515_03125 [Clostridia bacterium]|nr:hypothetical protein [Clostridia bacterium]
MRYDGFTKEDEVRFIELTALGVTALYIYTDKLISCGVRTTYGESADERAIAYSGEMYAPVSLFVRFLGASCSDNGTGVTLSLGDRCVDLRYERKTGYLPVAATCSALGLYTKQLCEGGFILIGDKERVDAIASDEVLVKAGPYALFGDYDTAGFTDEDYEAVAKNFHDRLVGTEQTNDVNNPLVRDKLAKINERCASALAGLDRSGDPIVLWGDKPLRDTEDGARQYSFLRSLAVAYGTYGSDYYGDKSVFDDIIYSLEWMYRHAYGEDMIAGHGWRDPKLPNWWYMYIGAPEHLADILLILYREISLEDRRRYLKCFEWIASWMCLGPNWRMTRIKICTEYGILLHEPKYLIQEAQDFDALLQVKRLDYVDFTHTYPHNMSYGGIYMSRLVYIASVLAGSPIEYNSPNSYKQFNRIKYMYEPAMYKGQAFFMLAGRYTKQLVEAAKSADFLCHTLSMIGVYGEDEDAYIKQFLKRSSANPIFRDTILKNASFVDLARFEQILADESIPYEYYYEYAHAWYTGDRAAQHRNNYAVGIAMASNRHINYESILHENKTGWYTGDGAFHLYTSYDTNQYDGDNFINNINIAYRFPGTTEDMQERVSRGICFNPWKAPNDFAGSIQVDSKYITAGMEFISEYCDEDTQQYDEVRGWSRAEHHNDLTCRKAWFCFDNEVVLLGAGITSTMSSPVNTIAAHRRIVNDESLSQLVRYGGELAELEKSEFERRYKNPDYVLWQGHAGFVFLENTNLYVSRYNYTTSKEQPYLELRIEHGANPTNASYAYAVIPYADEETLDRYSKSPDVCIISNTKALQAVKESTIGITGMVFYEAGECEGVKVDTGAIVMLKECGGVLEFSICDPTQKQTELSVSISGSLEPVDADDKVSVSVNGDCVKLKINCADSMGAPFRARFRRG